MVQKESCGLRRPKTDGLKSSARVKYGKKADRHRENDSQHDVVSKFVEE